ncbi:MAG: right-handed parallel beta-helix repeat-containing protein [Planctomycetota bacterium]
MFRRHSDENFLSICLTLTLSFLMVATCAAAAEDTSYVAPWGDSENPGTKEDPWGSISYAVTQLQPGSTLVLLPGAYKGARIQKVHGTSEETIVIRGQNRQACIINGAARREGEYKGGRDAIWFDHCSHMVLENVSLINAPRAGVLVGQSHHITVRDCLVRGNTEWGLFTNHSPHVTFENCEVSGSEDQHGIYFANGGSDHCVARGNIIHHNAQCGIQVNGDPAAGGDGIISDVLIEKNVIHHTGENGGAAMNMTFIQDSVIRNNLCYANEAGGIVIYRDAHKAPDKYSRGIKVLNNTVYFAPDTGRWAFTAQYKSRDITVLNNIFYGGRYGAHAVSSDSQKGLVSTHNVIYNHPGQGKLGDSSEGWNYAVEEWKQKGYDRNSRFKNPQFVNPKKGDFHVKGGSPAIGLGTALPGVEEDLEGKQRPQEALTAGCYEHH